MRKISFHFPSLNYDDVPNVDAFKSLKLKLQLEIKF